MDEENKPELPVQKTMHAQKVLYDAIGLLRAEKAMKVSCDIAGPLADVLEYYAVTGGRSGAYTKAVRVARRLIADEPGNADMAVLW